MPENDYESAADELADLKARRAVHMEKIQEIDDRAAEIVTKMNATTAAAVKDWGHVIAAPPVTRTACDLPAGVQSPTTLCVCGHTADAHRATGDCEICDHPLKPPVPECDLSHRFARVPMSALCRCRWLASDHMLAGGVWVRDPAKIKGARDRSYVDRPDGAGT